MSCKNWNCLFSESASDCNKYEETSHAEASHAEEEEEDVQHKRKKKTKAYEGFLLGMFSVTEQPYIKYTAISHNVEGICGDFT